jgi:signal peptidase II
MLSDGRLRRASIVAALIFVVDQVTKSVVQHAMVTNESIPLTSFLALTYVRNPGAAFGLLAGVPGAVRLPLLLAVTGAAVWVLVAFLRDAPAERRALVAAIGAVLGGAAGNLVCRVRYGEVVDFIHLHWRGFDWPMFNVADSAISVGVCVILLYSLRAPAAASAPR